VFLNVLTVSEILSGLSNSACLHSVHDCNSTLSLLGRPVVILKNQMSDLMWIEIIASIFVKTNRQTERGYDYDYDERLLEPKLSQRGL